MTQRQMQPGVSGYTESQGTPVAKPKFRVISADSHILEPPDLWTTRVPAKYRDLVPQLKSLESHDEWFMGDESLGTLGSAIMQAGHRVEYQESGEFGKMDRDDWTSFQETIGRWGDVLPGGYDPKEMLKDQDLDNVYGVVLYPSMGLGMFRRPNSPLLREMFRAYNEWIGEFCSVDYNRLKGIGMILLDDVEDSVKELERCAKMKLGGVQIPTYPEPHKPYYDPCYEPFWEAAAALEMPLGLHIQSWRPQPASGQLRSASVSSAAASAGAQAPDIIDPGLADFVGKLPDTMIDPSWAGFIGNLPKFPKTRSTIDFLATTDYWVRRAIGEMIFSKVFERHPKLKVVCVEYDTGFVPYFLNRMDWTYVEFPEAKEIRFNGGKLPSEFWLSNVLLTFQEDPLGVQRLRDLIGVETMMWGNDYPHRESTWPKSMERIQETFEGVPEAEMALITGGNASKLYKIK